MNGKILTMVMMGIFALLILNGCTREHRMRDCGKSCCHHTKNNCKTDFSAIVEELNLNEQQQKEFEKIRSSMHKEMRKEYMFHFTGNVDHEKMLNIMIANLEKFENILDNTQKEKFRKIVIEKHSEKHMQHKEISDEMIAKILPKLNLTEEEKIKFDAVLVEMKSAKNISEQLAVVNKINNLLNPQQQKTIFQAFIENCPNGKMLKELKLTDSQMDQFIVINRSFIPKMAESFAAYERGEKTLSSTLKELMAEKDKMKAVLTAEQLKTLEKIGKEHHKNCGKH